MWRVLLWRLWIFKLLVFFFAFLLVVDFCGRGMDILVVQIAPIGAYAPIQEGLGCGGSLGMIRCGFCLGVWEFLGFVFIFLVVG